MRDRLANRQTGRHTEMVVGRGYKGRQEERERKSEREGRRE